MRNLSSGMLLVFSLFAVCFTMLPADAWAKRQLKIKEVNITVEEGEGEYFTTARRVGKIATVEGTDEKYELLDAIITESGDKKTHLMFWRGAALPGEEMSSAMMRVQMLCDAVASSSEKFPRVENGQWIDNKKRICACLILRRYID